MRILSERALVAPLLMVLALTAGGCGRAEEQPTGTSDSPTSETERDQGARQALAPEARTDGEQAFLDDLAQFGLPTGMSANTTVEVGIGICLKIAEGVDDETILDQIRPLSSAIASQIEDIDTAGVGRALVDASRTHLCD